MRSAGSSHRFHTPPERSLAGALIIFAGAPSQSLFLTQPRYSLAVDDPSNIWAIGLLFVVGLIASGVAFTSRRRAADAERLGMQAAIVQRYSRDVVAADNVDSILSITSRYLATLFRAPAVAMLVADDMVVSIKRAGDMEPQEAELGAAKSSLATGSVVRGGVNPNETSRFDSGPCERQKAAMPFSDLQLIRKSVPRPRIRQSRPWRMFWRWRSTANADDE